MLRTARGRFAPALTCACRDVVGCGRSGTDRRSRDREPMVRCRGFRRRAGVRLASTCKYRDERARSARRIVKEAKLSDSIGHHPLGQRGGLGLEALVCLISKPRWPALPDHLFVQVGVMSQDHPDHLLGNTPGLVHRQLLGPLGNEEDLPRLLRCLCDTEPVAHRSDVTSKLVHLPPRALTAATSCSRLVSELCRSTCSSATLLSNAATKPRDTKQSATTL